MNQEEKLDAIQKDVSQIKTLLQGNVFDKNDNGMIGQVDTLEKRIFRLERLKDRGMYLVIGLSIGAGYAMSDIIIKIFGHK